MQKQVAPKEILVLGGGYAGVMAALRVAGKTRGQPVTVTLLNGLAYFVERPRLHEEAGGAPPRRRPLTEMLRGSGVRFHQGWVTYLDPAARAIRFAGDEGTAELTYDYLIYALGSRVDRRSVPGVEQHAYTLDPWGDLTTSPLRAKLESLAGTSARIVVIGGGPTGLEAAGEIKARLPEATVTLITRGEAGAFQGPLVRRHIMAALREQAIIVREQSRVVAVTEAGVQLATELLPADITLWAGGFVAPTLAREAGLRVNERNQILVDPYLRSLSAPRIYAVGDAMQPVEEPGAPARMALFTAIVSGAQAAENIAADLRGSAPRPLSYAWYGQGVALGRRDAVGFATYPNDVAWNLVLRRGLAVNVRSFFVTLLRLALEVERRAPGLLSWNGRRRYQRQQQRARQAVDAAALR